MQGRLIAMWNGGRVEMETLLAGHNFAMWNYSTEEELNNLMSDNAFGFAVNYLNIGDIIIVNAKDATAQLVVTGIQKPNVCVKILSKCEY